MKKVICDQPVSVRDIDRYLPVEIVDQLQTRFYHASVEFRKMKVHIAKLKKRRGYKCPWGEKLSEDAWVRKVRKQWQENPPTIAQTRRGNPGWGFIILLKIWIYAAFFRSEQNAAEIFGTLDTNPKYASLCGLVNKKVDQKKFELPSDRTIRHFNQVMYTFKLWSDFARLLVFYNLEQNVFQWAEELVIDPSHFDAFASVNKTCKACNVCPKKKRCQFVQVTCSMTGIVSKSENFKLPGVKLNFACLPGSEIVVMTLACQGQVHDSNLLRPLLLELLNDFPQLQGRIKKILADAAYDDPKSHETSSQVLDAELITPVNPRNRKAIKDPARGIEKINPSGIPVCIAGHQLIMTGRDHQREQYLWACPVFSQQHADPDLTCSIACKKKCCPDAEFGRTLRINRDLTPQINWQNPQHLKSVAKIYDQRTCVERAISRCKRILKFERFYNRGRKPLQAHGDRYVIDILLVALVAHMLDCPGATCRYRLSG